MVEETLTRVWQNDPTHGNSCADGEKLNIWVNASSLAISILLEEDGIILEDACWLRPVNNTAHINLAELDAVLKVVNQALQRKAKRLHLRTDSLCMYYWISDTNKEGQDSDQGSKWDAD